LWLTSVPGVQKFPVKVKIKKTRTTTATTITTFLQTKMNFTEKTTMK
jgi:hypothetical protein